MSNLRQENHQSTHSAAILFVSQMSHERPEQMQVPPDESGPVRENDHSQPVSRWKEQQENGVVGALTVGTVLSVYDPEAHSGQ